MIVGRIGFLLILDSGCVAIFGMCYSTVQHCDAISVCIPERERGRGEKRERKEGARRDAFNFRQKVNGVIMFRHILSHTALIKPVVTRPRHYSVIVAG
jgi:hypothetical protein